MCFLMFFYFIFMVSLSAKIKVTVNSENTLHSCLFLFFGSCKTARYLWAKRLALLTETLLHLHLSSKTLRKLIPNAESWQTEHAVCLLLTKLSVQHKTYFGMFYFIIGENTHFIMDSVCSSFKRTSFVRMYITCTDTEVLSHEGRVFSTMAA